MNKAMDAYENFPPRGLLISLLTGIVLLMLFSGCAQQPVEEINAARTAVDSAAGEGSEKYAPADARRINAEMAAALNEVKVQEAKLFRDYKKATVMLNRAKADADAVKASLPARKEEARKKAVASVEAAITAVDEAKNVIVSMAGKSVKNGAEAIGADVKGLDETLADILRFMKQEDYIAADEKASALRGKAEDIARSAGQPGEKKKGLK